MIYPFEGCDGGSNPPESILLRSYSVVWTITSGSQPLNVGSNPTKSIFMRW